MHLTEKPEFVTLPAAHYLYVEKTGPFSATAMAAWTEVGKLLEASGAKAS